MKYIYLDQNKWIELAKGVKNNKTEYCDLYDKIIRNVQNNSLAFPISPIHLTETMKRNDEKSRNDILNLMFSLSNCFTICDYTTADKYEFDYWINNTSIDINSLKNTIVRRDWSNILGLSTNNLTITSNNSDISSEHINSFKELIVNHSYDRKVFNIICNIFSDAYKDDISYFEDYKTVREQFILWKTLIMTLDEYKEKYLYSAFLIKVFFTVYNNTILCMSPQYKQNFSKMFSTYCNNKTNTIALLEALPGFNIHSRLVFEMCNNPDKPVHPHDFNDLAYLRVAVPYCDIVIGENYWCDRVKNYKLDKKYNTNVFTKLLDLKEYL